MQIHFIWKSFDRGKCTYMVHASNERTTSPMQMINRRERSEAESWQRSIVRLCLCDRQIFYNFTNFIALKSLWLYFANNDLFLIRCEKICKTNEIKRFEKNGKMDEALYFWRKIIVFRMHSINIYEPKKCMQMQWPEQTTSDI